VLLQKGKATFFAPTNPSTIQSQVKTDATCDKIGILLVIAHPDDESMFFVPAISAVTGNQSSKSDSGRSSFQVFLLCMSSGNADQIGYVRKRELMESARILGIPPKCVCIIEDEQLQDGMDQVWNPQIVSRHVSEYVQKVNSEHKLASDNGDVHDLCPISIIWTFDKFGVSGHPNHIAVHQGVGVFLQQQHASGSTCIGSFVQGYALESWSLWCKYLGLLGIFGYISFQTCFWEYIMHSIKSRLFLLSTSKDTASIDTGIPCSVIFDTNKRKHSQNMPDKQFYQSCELPSSVMFINASNALVYNTMHTHYSQFVWYRKLFVLFSMYSNACLLRRM
jgi:N-acetylglucosaminylphosphatidylinositol deacetylase